jgi:rifampicin phosphotransferase
MRWILFPTDVARAAEMGGKARALAALPRAALPIPDWFVLTGGALNASLPEPARQKLTTATTAAEILGALEGVQPDLEVVAEINAALARLLPADGFVAVRSSASDEDGAEHSFAGQLESHLFVARERVAEKVAAVWRSGFSEHIIAYRQQHGLALTPRAPAVLVQRMVNADAAGVAFSADPVSGRRGVAVVSAVFGLGSALVSGEANADNWFVDRAGNILETRLGEKSIAHRAAPDTSDGVRAEAVSSERARQPALTEEQVRSVAELARRCAAHFGRPQDIEWAIEGGKLFLLQSRPITSLAAMPDPDGGLNLWDNSNIAESYGGVTTPLTYTFARRAYEEVYRQFCRLMAVPTGRIAASANVFRCMIGLVRGRVYYNLLNWYRVLALLPGYTVNRRFMEQMMGVKEGLPEELTREFQPATTADRLKDSFHLAVSIAGLVWNHLTLQGRSKHFYARLNDALRPPAPPLEQMRPDELVAHYQDLERRLLTRWDAPLVNDFFAMIFYGVLRKLVGKWCGDADGTLQNNLLCGEGGIISAEPARRVRELAQLAAKHPELVRKLTDAPLEEILGELDRVPEFAASYRAYLDKFGDRCLDELKLESATLHDDPMLLLRSVGHLAKRWQAEASSCAAKPLTPALSPSEGERETRASRPVEAAASDDSGIEMQLRRQAEARVMAALRGHPLRRVVFNWALRQTRQRVRDRENLRFERTRLFGRVRRVFVALGREFHARDLLAAPPDIFYLELEEVLGFCDGTTTTANLKELVALRRAEFARYAEMEPPADRFDTRGPVHHGNLYQRTAGATNAATEGDLKGIGCCPGVVRGHVRVVTDPRNAVLKPGEILVAERTDPGWIMLFASAAGLLVERGSLLSHSAIVSREMGIPSIVAIAGLMRQLKDGDEVELNGSTGVVKKINHD